MNIRKMNVLIYAGIGSGDASVWHCQDTLRKLLEPFYAVIPVSAEQIIKEPWEDSCAAVAFPGGADREYCRALNGAGNHRIRSFVEGGGIYIGFCAGGYYGSRKCEFEVGNELLEVVGQRELAFMPGIARGAAFSGFVYDSEQGTRAAQLQVSTNLFPSASVPKFFRSYYNGGAVFVDAGKCHDHDVEVLASYAEELAVDPGRGSAAIVYCRVGKGGALLTGPHPEFAAANLHDKEESPSFDKIIQTLTKDERHRGRFLKACLTKVGLQVAEEQITPSISCLHLSSLTPSDASKVYGSLREIVTVDQGQEYVRDDYDVFHIINRDVYGFERMGKALPQTSQAEEFCDSNACKGDDRTILIKKILFHEIDYPPPEVTPHFDHHKYFASLVRCQKTMPEAMSDFGRHLLYGEVATSTNSLLEKNAQLLSRLPSGFTTLVTTQLAGRGRGTNVWLSPPGSLTFSVVIRHPIALMQTAPVVFVQHLAALAILESIKSSHGGRYQNLPLKLKWPNDIYALDPAKVRRAPSNASKKADSQISAIPASTSNHDEYVKIGGILVNSQYDSQNYVAVCGIGLNLSNNLPTISVNALASHYLGAKQQPTGLQESDEEPFTAETILPSILTTFDALYTRFLRTGFDVFFQQKYYGHWLHDNQIITLEAGVEPSSGGDVKARIKGITPDFGLLVVEEVVAVPTDEGTGDGDKEGFESGLDTVDDHDDDKANDGDGGAVRQGYLQGSRGGERAQRKGWRGTGQVWKLQSDSNSFDFFKGFIKKKL